MRVAALLVLTLALQYCTLNTIATKTISVESVRMQGGGLFARHLQSAESCAADLNLVRIARAKTLPFTARG